MKTVTEADAKRRLAASVQPVALVFMRPGFAPSEELLASMDAAESALADRLEMLCVNVTQATSLASDLRVFKVPEILVFAPGGARMLGRMEGAMRPSEALDFLTVALSR